MAEGVGLASNLLRVGESIIGQSQMSCALGNLRSDYVEFARHEVQDRVRLVGQRRSEKSRPLKIYYSHNVHLERRVHKTGHS